MERHIPIEVAFLLLGALYGLIVGIPCNLWSSTFIEIFVNGRTDLWSLFGWLTFSLIGSGIVLLSYGVLYFRRGRDLVLEELVLLRSQLQEMKKQIEHKMEEHSDKKP